MASQFIDSIENIEFQHRFLNLLLTNTAYTSDRHELVPGVCALYRIPVTSIDVKQYFQCETDALIRYRAINGNYPDEPIVSYQPRVLRVVLLSLTLPELPPEFQLFWKNVIEQNIKFRREMKHHVLLLSVATGTSEEHFNEPVAAAAQRFDHTLSSRVCPEQETVPATICAVGPRVEVDTTIGFHIPMPVMPGTEEELKVMVQRLELESMPSIDPLAGHTFKQMRHLLDPLSSEIDAYARTLQALHASQSESGLDSQILLDLMSAALQSLDRISQLNEQIFHEFDQVLEKQHISPELQVAIHNNPAQKKKLVNSCVARAAVLSRYTENRRQSRLHDYVERLKAVLHNIKHDLHAKTGEQAHQLQQEKDALEYQLQVAQQDMKRVHRYISDVQQEKCPQLLQERQQMQTRLKFLKQQTEYWMNMYQKVLQSQQQYRVDQHANDMKELRDEVADKTQSLQQITDTLQYGLKRGVSQQMAQVMDKTRTAVLGLADPSSRASITDDAPIVLNREQQRVVDELLSNSMLDDIRQEVVAV